MSEEIQLDGKEYVSSKRAADLSGYAQDYVGQLARSGQIDARRVGGLWYVLPESLLSYKVNANEYTPTPPSQGARPDTLDSLISFEGNDYISSIRASKLTGYHQDYIGQLARSGTVLSRQVGNRWYIGRESLLSHKEEKDGLLEAVQAQSVGLGTRDITNAAANEVPHNDDLYFNYVAEGLDLLPKMSEKEDEGISELSDKYVLDLQSTKTGRTVPIKIQVPAMQVEDRSIAPQNKRLIPVSAQRSRRRLSSTVRHVGAGLLTIVIVLSLGFATFKDRSMYAFVSKNIPQKGSIEDMEASATSAFDQLGSMLEQRFVPEVQYQRTN